MKRQELGKKKVGKSRVLVDLGNVVLEAPGSGRKGFFWEFQGFFSGIPFGISLGIFQDFPGFFLNGIKGLGGGVVGRGGRAPGIPGEVGNELEEERGKGVSKSRSGRRIPTPNLWTGSGQNPGIPKKSMD